MSLENPGSSTGVVSALCCPVIASFTGNAHSLRHPTPDLFSSPSQTTSSIAFSPKPSLDLQPELESTSEHLKHGELLEDDCQLCAGCGGSEDG